MLSEHISNTSRVVEAKINVPSGIGVSGVAYYQAPVRYDVDELAAEGRIQSCPSELRKFGFSTCRIADKNASDIAIEVGRELMEANKVSPDDVGILICAHAIATSAVVTGAGSINLLDSYTNNNLELFKFAASRLQYELGLTHARVLGLSDLGCVSLINAVALAKDLLPGTGKRYALCVNADVLPAKSSREVLYSVISDAGCAVLVDMLADGCHIKATSQLAKGFYWDCETRHNELLAAYFPTAARFIQKFLRENGTSLDDIDRILPNNVSERSWEILSNLLGVDIGKIYTPNISKAGHSIAADNFMNLKDALGDGSIARGQKVLLFGFGLGAYWSAMLLNL